MSAPDQRRVALPRIRARGDLAAVAFLLGLVTMTAWARLTDDMWMARVDILQQQLPYYTFLGEQLRAGNIPGWTPFQLSGQPFLADPLSGWMQLPVMAMFSTLDPVVAYKAVVVFNLGLAALATYAFARTLGMGIPAGIVAAIGMGFGTLIHFNTYCCNIMGNFAPWIPVTLLGVELAVRAQRWVPRLAALGLAGLGVSQLLAAWLGQGTFYAVFLVGGYVLYRTVLSPPYRQEGWTRSQRAVALLVVGFGVVVAGFGLAAAGLLPRLDISRYSTLSGGNYDALGVEANSGMPLSQLLNMLFDSQFVARRIYVGTGVMMLAILAPIFARRQFAVPFFATVTIVGWLLTLEWSPVHELFFLIPQFETLHTHSDYRILGALLLGPPMLAAATVDAMLRVRVRWPLAATALMPALFYLFIQSYLVSNENSLSVHVLIVLGLGTLLIGALLLWRIDRDWWQLRPLRRLSGLVVAGLILLLVADPAGIDTYEIATGTNIPQYLQQEYLQEREAKEQTVETYTSCTDPGGAGEFLQQQAAVQNQPFRYFGYDAVRLRSADNDTDLTTSYHGAQITFQHLLVGTRATCLGIYDLQGYSPVQVQRYWDFLQAVNGERLNYHDAVILTSGFDSPLLSLLNPAYVITPRVIPEDRPDLQHVAATLPEVFANDQIRVFENTRALPHAWIVHEALSAPKDQVLDLLASGDIDLRQTAVVEGSVPALSPSAPGAAETITFESYEPDRMEIRVDSTGDGLLVLSEIYSPGWKAYVDGEQRPIVATDYVLRGVAVPAGSHLVELRYELDSLRVGLWISGVTAIALIGVVLLAAWQVLRSRRLALAPAQQGRPDLDAPAEDFDWARRIEAAMQPDVLRERGAANLQPRFWGTAWLDRQGSGSLFVWRRDLPVALVLGMVSLLYAWIRVGLTPDFFRGDILTQFLPFYPTVAERFASGDLPGWNPAMFSGVPLAGDPISGWGYVPVLLSFAIFAPLTAYKVHIIVHIVGAGLATYFFARSLRMGPLGAFAAGLSFVLGPHYQYAQCCTARMQLGPWIPLGLLAVELAVRSRTALIRWIWWGVAGLSIGQMIAGYFGKGMYYGVMVVGSYLAYRTLIAPTGGANVKKRLVLLLTHGLGVFSLGAGFAAWAFLPRTDFIERANLAGGTYEVVAPSAINPPNWTVAQALGTILSPDRPSYFLGSATVALAIAGVLLGWRRYSVPYFVLLSFCVVALTLKTTPVQHFFYLLPRFQRMHEHEPQQILMVLNIGPAMLVGAAVSAVQQRVAPTRKLIRAGIGVPLIAVLFVALAERGGQSLGHSVLSASIATGVLLGACAAAPLLFSRRLWSSWATTGLGAMLVLFLAANLDGGKLGDGYSSGFGSRGVNDLATSYADNTDVDGAGGFLRDRQANGEFFRYFGYNSDYLSTDDDFLDDNYRSHWRDEFSAELLVNNRAVTLGLQDIQGYDPIYYMDYLRFIDAVNGQPQEYHETNVLPSGLNSPLLRLLNVRYVVVPDRVPVQGSDLAWLNESYRQVFRNGEVRVLEIPDALPRAWVVHDAQQEEQEAILPFLASGAVDPLQTALLAEPAPSLEPLPTGASDTVTIAGYEPDRITLSASVGASGLLVLSEMYDPAWEVLVDGKPAELLKVNGLLRAVAVPAGSHDVEFRYAPTALRVGMFVTGSTVVVFILGALGLRLRKPITRRIQVLGISRRRFSRASR